MDLLSLFKQNFTEQAIELIDSVNATHKYGKTTFSEAVKIDVGIVVLQISVISDILTLANQYKFHLFPISSGKNWGYGSVQDENSTRPRVVLDLSKLKKITATCQDLGLITLQPGVTQQELYDFLQTNNWKYMTPVTGAGPNCSIVSNAIERGYGITPRTDHFLAVNALKAYFPHPNLCTSEYSSAVSSQDGSGTDFIDKTYKWGVGPYIDGILTQSNLGIVTEMTIRLAPTPEHFCSFYIKIPNESIFEKGVLFIRQLLLEFEGVIGSINLMDRNRLISMTTENPNTPSMHTNMTENQIKSIAERNKLPSWMIVGSIYGQKSLVKVVKKIIKKKMNTYGIIYFSDSFLFKLAEKIFKLPLPNSELVTSFQRQLSSLNEGKEIMVGKPNQIALPLAYWRNPKVRPDKSQQLFPDKDECGLLWYAPLLPMKPKALSEFVHFVRATTPKYDIEPLITFTNLKHDCVDATVPLIFDLKNKDALSKAHKCLDELVSKGCAMGYVPYRLNTSQQAKLDKNTIFWQVIAEMKKTLDPNNIISPDRYNPK